MNVYTEEELKKSICPLGIIGSYYTECVKKCHFCQKEYVEDGPCAGVYYYCLLSDVLEHYINERD